MHAHARSIPRFRGKHAVPAALAGALALAAGAPEARCAPREEPRDGAGTAVEETRLALGKWIETQQIIAKERNDWQQGREILVGRLELVDKEVASLEEKLAKAQDEVARAERKRAELEAERALLDADLAFLAERALLLEGGIRRLCAALPAGVREKVDLLIERMPKEPLAGGTATRVTAAERFQNVLVILNEVNKANSELSVAFEVRTLAGGKPAEVQVLYVGLGQAYYVSGSGEAGVGWPGAEGWTWTASSAAAGDVLTALEIVQGKHSPAFVPLPVTIR